MLCDVEGTLAGRRPIQFKINPIYVTKQTKRRVNKILPCDSPPVV